MTGRQAILAAHRAGVSVSIDGDKLVLDHDGEVGCPGRA
jgi:hypothetical protein